MSTWGSGQGKLWALEPIRTHTRGQVLSWGGVWGSSGLRKVGGTQTLRRKAEATGQQQNWSGGILSPLHRVPPSPLTPPTHHRARGQLTRGGVGVVNICDTQTLVSLAVRQRVVG